MKLWVFLLVLIFCKGQQIIEMDINVPEDELAEKDTGSRLMQQLSKTFDIDLDGNELLSHQYLVYSNFYVGTPKQKLAIELDTGSSWTWLATNLCKKSCNNNVLFNVIESTTF